MTARATSVGFLFLNAPTSHARLCCCDSQWKGYKDKRVIGIFFRTSIVGKTEKVSLAKCLWMFFSFGRMNQYVPQNIQETSQICCTMADWFTGTKCGSLNCLISQVCPPPSTLGRGGACDIYTSKQCLQLQEEEINGDWQQRPGNLMFWRAFNYVYHRYTEDNKIVWAEHKHSGDSVCGTLRAIIPLTKILDGLEINEKDSNSEIIG